MSEKNSTEKEELFRGENHMVTIAKAIHRTAGRKRFKSKKW